MNDLTIVFTTCDKYFDLCDGFSYRRQFALYKTSLQIGLYQTDFLKEMLKRDENPWEFEIYGSFRAFFNKGIFICKTDDYHVFPYSHGKLVGRGKYNNELKKYFELKENIEFSDKRDIYYKSSENASSLKRKVLFLLYVPISFLKKKPK